MVKMRGVDDDDDYDYEYASDDGDNADDDDDIFRADGDRFGGVGWVMGQL